MKRENILLYIMVNEIDSEQIERYLQKNQYFDYVGIIMFTNVRKSNPVRGAEHQREREDNDGQE